MLKIEFNEEKNLVTIEGQEFSQDTFRQDIKKVLNPDWFWRTYVDDDGVIKEQYFKQVTAEDQPDGNDLVIRPLYGTVDEIKKELKLE